jgi:hypothetical protein
MAVGDVYRLTINAVGLGHQFMNTYAFTMKSSPDPTDADATSLANGFKEISRVTQSNNITYQTWSLRQLYGGGVTVIQDECRRDGGIVLEGNFSGSVVGGSSTDMLPPQCALVWTIRTGLAGRRRRGRSYVFGFPESQQIAGTWIAAALTTMTTSLNTIYGLYGPSGTDPQFLLGVWSERTASGCVYQGNPPTYQNIETPHPELAFNMSNDYLIRPTVYTQRRRTLGVGR